jgi:hypothetical protein
VNLLTDELPDSVEIDGKEYLLNTDFRNCLNIMLAYGDANLTDDEKYQIMLVNLYPVIPDNIEAAIEKALMFLDEGKKPSGKGDSKPRVYSWSKDANMIYSAFKQTHNIDLTVEKMHWWKFVALFMDLGANTAFSSIVNLRSRVKSNKATKEEKAAAHELGDLFEIDEQQEDIMSDEDIEKRNTFMSQLRGSHVRQRNNE